MQATAQNPPHAGVSATTEGSRKTYARWIGAAFLVGFLVYGGGLSLVTTIVGAPDLLGNVATYRTALIIGAVLMLLVTITDIGKGVLFFPLLENHGKRTAVVYLAAIVVQVVFLDIGALFILMLVSVSQIAAESGASASWAPGVGALLAESNTIAYNVGQAILCFGGVFLSLLLYRTGMIPRALAGLGVVGYVLHAAGSFGEIFGIPLSLVLLIPGGIFEVVIAFWLIFKGFRPAAVSGTHDSPTATDSARRATANAPVAA